MTAEERAKHCRRIGPHGGAVTRDRHGSTHYRMAGKAGYAACVAKHGMARCLGIVRGKGWTPAAKPSLAADLAFAREYPF